MKPEIDINLKARFYAQYIGQKVIEGSPHEFTMWDLPHLVNSNIPLCLKRMKVKPEYSINLKNKGFAINFEFYAVNELIELGWIKIIEK